MKRITVLLLALAILFGTACATPRVVSPIPNYVCSVPGAPTAIQVLDLEDARDACVARVEDKNKAAVKEAEARAEAERSSAVGWTIIVIGAAVGGVVAVACGTGNCASEDQPANRQIVTVPQP